MISIPDNFISMIAGYFLSSRNKKNNFIKDFERTFSEYTGIKHSVATCSGRIALLLILKAYNFPADSEIILPAYEDISLLDMIEKMSLKPVFVDIDKNTANILPDDINKAITDNTAAIIVAHLFGNPADIIEITELAKLKKLIVIEDCAHSLGTRIKDRHTGTFGNAAFFSFDTTKPGTTFGGGMAITDNDLIFNKISEFSNILSTTNKTELIRRVIIGLIIKMMTVRIVYGLLIFPALYVCYLFDIDTLDLYNMFFRKHVSIKLKMSNFTCLQAYIGLMQMKLLDKNLQKRKRNALLLDRHISEKIKRLQYSTGSNYYFYVIKTDKIDAARKTLFTYGIDTGKNLMRNCGKNSNTDFVNTELLLNKSMQIPVYETLSTRTILKISEIINKVLVN
ncbi:DegT/DnrJ/EryC1/StrS family aminotransferase [Elusimicrobiota bacterium]